MRFKPVNDLFIAFMPTPNLAQYRRGGAGNHGAAWSFSSPAQGNDHPCAKTPGPRAGTEPGPHPRTSSQRSRGTPKGSTGGCDLLDFDRRALLLELLAQL